MPRTAIALQDVTAKPRSAVVTLTVVDAVNNNMFLNDGRTLIIVRNPTGGTLSITFVSVADSEGRTGDLTRALLASEVWVAGPFPQNAWNQTAADVGNVYVNPAAALTIGALKLAV
jgi:hypothetical protein